MSKLRDEHQGQHLEWRQTGWYWCSCRGNTPSLFTPDAGTLPIVFIRPTLGNYEAEDKTLYIGQPRRIAMDVPEGHAREFIARGLAREMVEQDRNNMTGYLAQA